MTRTVRKFDPEMATKASDVEMEWYRKDERVWKERVVEACLQKDQWGHQ